MATAAAASWTAVRAGGPWAASCLSRAGGSRSVSWNSCGVSLCGVESRRALQLAVGGSSKSSRRSGKGDRFARLCCVAGVQKLGEVDAVDLSSDGSKEFPAAPGVYAIYDKEGKLQYVGISRRVSSSIQSHLQDLPELCASVKVNVVDAADKTALTEAWREWVQEYVEVTGEVPPGNVQGNTTWTARKQRAAKPELKLTPGPHVTLTIPLVELIDQVVKGCTVVAFVKGTRTAPQCGFSHRVLTILNENGADYEVVNVLDDHHNPGLREAIKEYSQWPTIPQVYVKGEFVGGADILDEMVQSGEIKSLFQKSRPK
ncbi:hypothetical protein AXG93_773s1130 [Marchantia polymorpha subsp. ruderalis]|uniref:Glutaredoxin domain-containing protein n=1 Tax=Marchantia polymorpha subsp. ruderalis TaxID=1480154 RepID=A0A176WA22_MARPO|nr:hypothetical protein AXG93_773s1130 [Marchantia polymorpha subsp. ruderalis]